ncbi:VWFA and cache domain-containing protein 1-like isoform X2 [Acropora palmata]
MSDKFKRRFDVARRLRKVVEAYYSIAPIPRTAKQCCKVDKSTLTYKERFRSKVDLRNICLLISGKAPSNPIHLDSDAILKEAISILNDYPFIKWQYFASQEGVYTSFPAYDDTNPCGRYDPRVRPFYLETATPEAKDVVLMIDTSHSMIGDKMKTAQEAARTVLSITNPRDQIGVVSFNDEASTYSGNDVSSCYSQRLALAVPINKNALSKYVDELIGTGTSKYKIAFEKACELFKASISEKDSKTKKKVILFLTDGDPSDTNRSLIFKTIRDCNTELKNSIIIFTYGIGNAVNQEILKDIANLNTAKYGYPANRTVGDITPGNFTYIENANDDTLITKMAAYYNFLPPVRLDNPIVSIPYLDAFGSGLLMSTTLPCYDSQRRFIGVAGTDINVFEDLVNDITFFNQDQKTYAFMISNSGRTLIHPRLPIPNEPYADPIFLDIRTLEKDAEFLEVFNSMIRGSSGSKTFNATRYLMRGGDMLEGVTVKKLPSTYYWYPVESTEFSIAVVVPVGYQRQILSNIEIPKNSYSFHYHRIDLISPTKPCRYFQQEAIKETTVVKFAPGAFVDPYSYIGLKETKIGVRILDDYMRGKSEENKILKPGIRDTVIATWKAENLWLRDKTELTQYLAWRFIGTSNGVFRKTPGSVLPNQYDPRTRPWYYSALSHSGLIVLTTPYLDVGGAGEVITLARTLYRQESTENVLGVVGTDFTLRYFHKLLAKVYSSCDDTSKYACFVMDNAGFLVLHATFMQPSVTEKDLEHVHITQKEKHIAEDLISKGFLFKKECRNVETIKKQSFYEVNLPQNGVDELTGNSRCKYKLAPISGTNVYLGVVKRDAYCAAEKCFCALNKECSPSNVTCECPCTSPLEFDYCRSLFPQSSVPQCRPVSPGPAGPVKTVNNTACLQKCFDSRCPERNSSKLCDAVVDCYWCLKNKDNLLLENPYCASSERCFRGIESSAREIECPTPDPPGKPKGLSRGQMAGIAVGSAIFLLLVIISVICGLRRYRNFADPPVTIDGASGASIPDVLLVRSNHNDGFETYDEIVDKDAGEEGLPSYKEVAQNNLDLPPSYVGIRAGMRNANLSGEEKPPPVPPSRRPTAFDGVRQRSKTEPSVEEIPLSTMPYGFSRAGTSNPTSVNSEHLPGAYVNSNDINAELSQLRNQNIPKQSVRKLSAPSRMDTRKYSPGDPPPLVPREWGSFRDGNKSTDTCPRKSAPVYSNFDGNFPPVIQEAEEGNTSDNDETDANGYITVVKSVKEQK